MVQELANLAKEREALLAASKPDAISRIGEELAEGIRGFTDRYERAVVIKELRDVIFNRQFDRVITIPLCKLIWNLHTVMSCA